MVKVVLWGALRDAAGGQSEFEMDVPTIHKVIGTLVADYPELEWQLENNVSIAVNGQVYRDAWFVELEPDAEVFILPKLQGG